MLVLSRKEGQGISLRNKSTGETIEVLILDRRNGRVVVGVNAPLEFGISRIENPKTGPTHETSAAESR